MKNRVTEARKRIEKRRQASKGRVVKQEGRPGRYVKLPGVEERHGLAPLSSQEFQKTGSKGHPLFNREWLIFRILTASALFLSAGILFKDTTPALDEARSAVTSTFEQEFQFAAVSTWYKDTFGTPVALLPEKEAEREGTPAGDKLESSYDYAVPVIGGKVTESFEKNGEGIHLETGGNSAVEAVKEGIVIFAGQKEEFGNTVIIQHADGTKTWETWYGNLEDIDVRLYDFIETKTRIGTVKQGDSGAGSFYFAIKQDGDFIDPLKVFPFE
ncbi:M23 family metallopeptidase [Bacillus marinisedimentorum]|uniref:M23 family metallopeptidase n=1 Tax=Bacillus marinisedimentorum TaxID=1821260 RepID=UPI000872A92F|nr:M23 family metallopeptidase [Bacillus marinisedimentorum]